MASWIRAPPALSAIQLSNKSSANQNEIDCAPFKVRGRKHRVVVQMAWAAKWALTATAPLPCEARNPFHGLGLDVVKGTLLDLAVLMCMSGCTLWTLVMFKHNDYPEGSAAQSVMGVLVRRT